MTPRRPALDPRRRAPTARPTPSTRAVWDAVALGLIARDARGLLLYANSLAERWLGLTWDQLSDREPTPAGWSLTYPDGTCVPLLQRCAEFESVGRSLSTRRTCLLRRADQQDRSLEVSAAPLQAPGEPTTGWLISLRDVTEQHDFVRQAELQRLQFETIVTAANEGIAVLDLDLRIRYANPRICDALGFASHEAVGQVALDLYLLREDSEQAREAAQRMRNRLEAGLASRAALWLPRKDGSRVWMLASASPLYDESGARTGSVLVLTDLSEQKVIQDIRARRAAANVVSDFASVQVGVAQLDRVLDHLSVHDPLTDIPNRRLFQDRLEHALLVARRDGTTLALMVLDLDGFKQVNDSFGHACGDGVLREIADRLKSVVRQSDTVARMGGDEFAVLLRMDGDESAVTTTAHKIRDALRQPMTIEHHVVEVDVSIGIARSPLDGSDADALYRHADSAMYDAKRERAGYTVYTPRLEQAMPNDVVLARELRQALQRDELHIVYQPEIDLQSGQLARVEALLRWQHPQRGLLRPDDFIPAAERTRVMAQVTRWVLSTVIRQLRTWTDSGWHVQVAVNLSAWDLRDTSLPEFIDGLLRRWHVDAALLAIETTETALIADPLRARETMNHLQALGIRLSLDDFGTGYSALSFIRDLPSQEIKIDQSFVHNVEGDRNNAAIVGALVHLAHQLGRSIVAEGVETQEAYNLLRNLGCDTAQGYFMAQPMSPGELEHWRNQTSTVGPPDVTRGGGRHWLGGAHA